MPYPANKIPNIANPIKNLKTPPDAKLSVSNGFADLKIGFAILLSFGARPKKFSIFSPQCTHYAASEFLQNFSSHMFA
jgi:hypothetical protein